MQFPELERITLNLMIMGGKPCIRGMRITFGTIVGLVASGASFEEILQLYPYLESEDIRAVVAYAVLFALEAAAEREIVDSLRIDPSTRFRLLTNPERRLRQGFFFDSKHGEIRPHYFDP
jgi:uncharacterized protein (DUF433 family)